MPHRVLLRAAATGAGYAFAGVLEPAYPLRTERLDLRPYEDGDLDDLRDMHGDPGVMRYLYWEPADRATSCATALAKRMQNRRVLRGEGDGSACSPCCARPVSVVGEAALFWVSEEHATGEVGYMRASPAHQGRGYATEMVAEMLRLAFEELGLHRVVGRLDARNTASARVLERLGMRREAHLVEQRVGQGRVVHELDYALLADEWAASRSSA